MKTTFDLRWSLWLGIALAAVFLGIFSGYLSGWVTATAAYSPQLEASHNATWSKCLVIGYNSLQAILIRQCYNQTSQAFIGTDFNLTNSTTEEVMLNGTYINSNAVNIYIQDTGQHAER